VVWLRVCWFVCYWLVCVVVFVWMVVALLVWWLCWFCVGIDGFLVCVWLGCLLLCGCLLGGWWFMANRRRLSARGSLGSGCRAPWRVRQRPDDKHSGPYAEVGKHRREERDVGPSFPTHDPAIADSPLPRSTPPSQRRSSHAPAMCSSTRSWATPCGLRVGMLPLARKKNKNTRPKSEIKEVYQRNRKQRSPREVGGRSSSWNT